MSDDFYVKLFRGETDWRDYRKRSTYGGNLKHRHDGNLDHATALHWLLHDKSGAAALTRLNMPAEDAANLLMAAAAMHPTEKRNEASNTPPINKREDNQMRENFDVVSFSKRVVDDGVSAISEIQATELIKHYTDANKLPGEKSSVAFARVFSADDDIGLNFRKMVQIAKGHAHPHV